MHMLMFVYTDMKIHKFMKPVLIQILEVADVSYV